jgi:hypothetical protein|tara:strand:+ start:2289 stop:3062 length:774 start_codon:yes stop_codon:yes gene_type:complete
MKQPIKVVMLPTEDKYPTIFLRDDDMLIHNTLKMIKWFDVIGYHLYITVSQDVEPIKEGDWCIEGVKNICPLQLVLVTKEDLNRCLENQKCGSCRKIIATNDPKLFTRTSFLEDISNNTVSLKCNLPQLQQSSLEEFVANPDGEWEVEYNDTCDVERGQCCCSERDVDCELHSFKLKLNQNNTVNITSVEICTCKPTLNTEGKVTKYPDPDCLSCKYIDITFVNNRSNKIKSIVEELRALVSAKAMIPLDNWIKENL